MISLALGPSFAEETTPAAIVRLTTTAVTTLVFIVVLLRFGLLALVVANFVVDLAPLAATPNFSAWHGQPTFLIHACIAGLAAYGYWAATAGRSPSAAPTSRLGKRPSELVVGGSKFCSRRHQDAAGRREDDPPRLLTTAKQVDVESDVGEVGTRGSPIGRALAHGGIRVHECESLRRRDAEVVNQEHFGLELRAD